MASNSDLAYLNPISAQPKGIFDSVTGRFSGNSEKQRGALTLTPGANERANQIYNAINSGGGRGTFNEEQFNQAISEFKKLQSELNEGKITQSDFATISDQFLPQVIQYGHQIAGTGSKAANAVKGSIAELEKYRKDSEIYKAGQELLGRDLTPQEFAQFKPRFADNVDTGRAYLAELAKQEANSPQALAKKAGQFSGQVNETFQQLLSRGASKEEADYFGRLLASGEVTPYEINQFVQALPEYQNIQDKSFRSGLEGELADYDEKAFARERENILSQYTRAGLQNSSALDFAITDALGKVQEGRGRYLSELSAKQYGGNKDAARSDYETYRNRYFDSQDYGRNRSDAYLDYLTKRADEGSDYTRQRDDYLNFLASQPKQRSRGSGLGQLAGGLIGAGIGAFGGPAGAGAGYQIGSGIGGGFDYFNS